MAKKFEFFSSTQMLPALCPGVCITSILSAKSGVVSCGIEDGTKWQQKIGLKVYAHKADENHPWLRMKPDVLFTIVKNY